MAIVANPADVLNQALVALGYPGRVGNLYDGSEAATKALDIYGETRDEVMAAKNWDFAFQQAAGVAGGASIQGYTNTFTYPSDCLRVLQIGPAVVPSPNYNPQPILWRVYNSISPSGRFIATTFTPILITYIARVTDPARWSSPFVAAFVQSLAAKIGPSLRKDLAPMLVPDQMVQAAANTQDKLPPNDAAVAPPMGGAPQRRAQQ